MVSFQVTTLKTNLAEDLGTSTLSLSVETEFIFLIDDLVASLVFWKKLIATSYLMLNELFCVEDFFPPVFAGCLAKHKTNRTFLIIATNIFK